MSKEKFPHVALVGHMGSGKSTVGPLLGKLMKCNHVDLDVVIANQAGRSIGVIFEEKGEKAFRDFEELALESKISNQEPLVISTGGGIVERAANRELLKEKSFVIWLRADTETLVKRVGNHPRGNNNSSNSAAAVTRKSPTRRLSKGKNSGSPSSATSPSPEKDGPTTTGTDGPAEEEENDA